MLPKSEILSSLDVSGHDGWSSIDATVRAYEIITLHLDLELGRKVTRDLDAHRDVGATAQR